MLKVHGKVLKFTWSKGKVAAAGLFGLDEGLAYVKGSCVEEPPFSLELYESDDCSDTGLPNIDIRNFLIFYILYRNRLCPCPCSISCNSARHLLGIRGANAWIVWFGYHEDVLQT